nr:hypothetical protein [Bacilli bacterium]
MQASGITTNQSPPYSLPMRYLVVGILFFGLFALDLARQASGLVLGDPGAPSVVALTHLLTLGALLSFVMGAVYQLTTVTFLVPLSSEKVAKWNFWLYVLGFTGLFFSMATWWSMGLVVFGTLVISAITIYACVLLRTLMKVKMKDAVWGFIVSAHLYLLLAISVAVLLILADANIFPQLNAVMPQLIITHILLAVGGFFTMLIMGFSFKLVPMFTLAHGFSIRGRARLLLTAHGTMVLLLIGIWTPYRLFLVIGLGLAIFALVDYLLLLRAIVKKRMRKRVDVPIRYAVFLPLIGIVTLLLVLWQTLIPLSVLAWQEMIMLYLLGYVTLSVIGFSYKIIPFLVWTKRYSQPQPGRKMVMIAELIQYKTTWPVMLLFAIALMGLIVSDTIHVQASTIGFALLLCVSIFLYLYQILRVLNLYLTFKEMIES